MGNRTRKDGDMSLYSVVCLGFAMVSLLVMASGFIIDLLSKISDSLKIIAEKIDNG